jgi:hypothetical protein
VLDNNPDWLKHLAQNILFAGLKDSPFLTPDASDLVQKVSVVVGHSLTLLLYYVQLLRKCPEHRLLDFNEIKGHAFFEGL